jgi:hypothetical protein
VLRVAAARCRASSLQRRLFFVRYCSSQNQKNGDGSKKAQKASTSTRDDDEFILAASRKPTNSFQAFCLTGIFILTHQETLEKKIERKTAKISRENQKDVSSSSQQHDRHYPYHNYYNNE